MSMEITLTLVGIIISLLGCKNININIGDINVCNNKKSK